MVINPFLFQFLVKIFSNTRVNVFAYKKSIWQHLLLKMNLQKDRISSFSWIASIKRMKKLHQCQLNTILPIYLKLQKNNYHPVKFKFREKQMLFHWKMNCNIHAGTNVHGKFIKLVYKKFNITFFHFYSRVGLGEKDKGIHLIMSNICPPPNFTNFKIASYQNQIFLKQRLSITLSLKFVIFVQQLFICDVTKVG